MAVKDATDGQLPRFVKYPLDHRTVERLATVGARLTLSGRQKLMSLKIVVADIDVAALGEREREP